MEATINMQCGAIRRSEGDRTKLHRWNETLNHLGENSLTGLATLLDR